MEKTLIKNLKQIEVKDLMYEIRGQQVMLDSDLAMLYGYTVKRLNEQVKRNIERFPDDFMFQLSDAEQIDLWSQFATAKKNNMSRSNQYAFTEQGVYMLSTVLKGQLAVSQSIIIMRAFKQMRHYLINNQSCLTDSEALTIYKKLYKHDDDILELKNQMATKEDFEKVMNCFVDENKIKEIVILNGQKFEADEAYCHIYREANHSIYLVDNYINIDTLSHLKCKRNGIEVFIFSDNLGRGKGKLRKKETRDFQNEYPLLKLKHNGLSHDRYIIIDYKTEHEKIYHCGASSKDAGRKLCGINQISDRHCFHPIIDELLTHKELILE